MRRAAGILLCLCLLLAGCGRARATLTATVTEIVGGTLLVRPAEGSPELRSSDSFAIPLNAVSDGTAPAVGDVYRIVYSGDIRETYPAGLDGIESVTRAKE